MTGVISFFVFTWYLKITWLVHGMTGIALLLSQVIIELTDIQKDRHTNRHTVYVHTIMCLRIRSATMGLNCIARQSIVIAFMWSYLTTKMYENDRRYFLRHVIQRSHAAWKAERQRWKRCVSLKLSCRPTLSTLMHSKRHAIIKSLRPELVVQSTDLWCSPLIP